MSLVALTREISSAIVRCELTHLERSAIDLGRARAEHARYEAALRAAGCRVERVVAGDELPDSVFIEDTAVVLDELAVVTWPGAPSRRAELPAVAAALGAYRPVAAMGPSGTLDGGDVVRIGRRLLVGTGGRSDAAGAGQLGMLVSPHGYSVEEVPFSGCLHLKTAATLVADDLLLVNPAWVEPARFHPLPTLAVDPAEPFAANALRIGGVVVFPAEYPRTRARLEAAGLAVIPVPAGELAKAEGGVTCCSLVFAV
ncbi:MAG TPA: hypothetical protein VNA89_11760 [Gemmatimonadaceae bacterium]|nr:hypothetical protein [Gemmatimonadaceae bacterium]